LAAILLTGASGFVGRGIAALAHARGHALSGPLRAGSAPPCPGRWTPTPDIAGPVDWSAQLAGVDVVIHCAALAHARPRPSDAARVFAVNTETPVRIAEAARRAGVKRFVFVSSVKAAALASARALTEADAPHPDGLYGRSKREAETALAQVAGLSVVALRPPLVIAADAKANAAIMLKLAASPWPLPFALARQPRSLVSRESLARAILAAAEAPGGPEGAFFWADEPALSTAEMLGALRAGLGRPAGLFPAPLPAIGPLKAALAPLVLSPAAFADAYGVRPGDARAMLAETALAHQAARVGKSS
jgi:UDP-glucose 4-epimerase